MQTTPKPAEKRHENAVRVARRLVKLAKAERDLRVQVEMQRLRIETLTDENERLRQTVTMAMAKIYQPEIDFADMPGDLEVGEFADLAGELGLRVRPRVE
jgi:hypothetical protein